MDIILGVFNSDYFQHIKAKTFSLSYGDFGSEIYFEGCSSEFQEYLYEDVISYVYLACEKAEKINFLLDRIKLPLNSESVTCGELMMVMEKNLVSKTQFWLRGERIETEKVLALITKVQEDELTFDNINLEMSCLRIESQENS